MENIPQEQTMRRFQALPQALQDAIFSDTSTDILFKSCALRDVPREKVNIIGQLTSRVLLGYLRPENFSFEIQKETGIDALKAAQIAHDIDAEVFSNVRLELKKLYPPTIHTPTVERPGFSGSESGMKNQELRSGNQELQTEQKPRYVVPIPEKFLKKTDNTQLTTDNKGAEGKKEAVKANEAHAAREASREAPQFPQAASEKANEAKEVGGAQKLEPKKDFIPPTKPVIPLPTFIHSKFRNQESGMKNQELGTAKADEKSFVDKLASPMGDKSSKESGIKN